MAEAGGRMVSVEQEVEACCEQLEVGGGDLEVADWCR